MGHLALNIYRHRLLHGLDDLHHYPWKEQPVSRIHFLEIPKDRLLGRYVPSYPWLGIWILDHQIRLSWLLNHLWHPHHLDVL